MSIVIEEVGRKESAGRGIWGYLSANIIASGRSPTRVMVGFVSAWAAFALIMFVLPIPDGLDRAGMSVLAIVVWASIMWVSEAMPVGITALGIPSLLILTHAIPWEKGKPPLDFVLQGFTRHVVWILLFGMMVGAIMQLLKLDRRLALGILDKIKASTAGRVIWGFFFVQLILSFFIPAAVARSATIMPIVQGVTNLLGDTEEEQAAKKAIIIQSLVYTSMIAGMFIMTAHLPNMILVGIFGQNGFQLGYLDWMLLQFPYLGMFVLTQWWVRYHFKTGRVSIAGGHAKIREAHRALGPMSTAEWVLIAMFSGIALFFMLGKGSPIYPVHSFQLGIIALIGISLVMFIPGLFPFKWKEVQDKTMWGTFLLLGGAITMTGAMTKSGLAEWLADGIHGIVTGHVWWMVLLLMMAGTHIMRIGMLSNVAAIAMLAPILFELGKQLGLHPVAFTMLVADTDTFAYLLPTQITAAVIAYGTDTFSATDYFKVGWVCVLLAIAYGIVIMAPWYAVLGLPVWDPSVPWPF